MKDKRSSIDITETEMLKLVSRGNKLAQHFNLNKEETS